MKQKSGNGKMRTLAVFLAVVLVVTGINLPFSVGSLQAAAKESVTGEVQEQNLDEPDTQEPDSRNSAITELTLEGSETEDNPSELTLEGSGTEDNPSELTLEGSGTEDNPSELTLEGSGTEEDPYKIASLENLENFQAYVNSGGETKGKYFSMMERIQVKTSQKPWEPIGTQEHPFEGTFQGVADSSKYLSLYSTYLLEGAEAALFGVNNGTIQDLLVGNWGEGDDFRIGDSYKAARAAGIAITNNGTISRCMVSCDVVAKEGAAGIAFENNGRIEDCQVGRGPGSSITAVHGKIQSSYRNSISPEPYGGIVGNNNASGTIVNCKNYLQVGFAGNYSGGTIGRIGGIAGYNAGTIENCENRANVYAYALEDVYNDEEHRVGLGGIVGVQRSTGILKDCFSAANITRISQKLDRYESQYWQGCIVGAFEDAAISTDIREGGYSKSCTETLKKAQRTAFSNISGCSFWWPEYDSSLSSKNCVRGAVGLWSNPQHIASEEPERIVSYSPTDVKNTDAYAIQAEYAPGMTVTTSGSSKGDAMRTVMADSVQGEGTEEEPYLIGTEEDLKAYRDYVNDGGPAAYARLTADITVTDKNWEGIGTLRQPFFGEFDGNGKSVTLDVKRDLNLESYNRSLTKNVTGLFGFNCGTIRNLTVKGSVSGGQRVGAVAGVNGDYYPVGSRGYSGARAYRGVIENCVNQAEVKGTGSVGGIVGMNVGGMDNHLYENRADGLSQITGCRNEGIVGLAESMSLDGGMIGGIAGYSAAGNITDCQNTAEISGERTVGGIVGRVGGDASPEETYLRVIQNCENTGNVKFTGEENFFESAGIGAIAGEIPDEYYPQEIKIEKIFVNCKYLMDAETNYKLPGVGNKEVKQYDGAITYTDNTTPEVPAEPEEFKNGAGTEEAPYLIENLNNFLYFAQNHEKGTYYKLGADIDLKGNEKNPWTPIGSGEKLFEGILDGDGHTIRGLYVGKPMKGEEKNNQGLFAKNGGTIQNLTVEGAVWGHSGIGGIAGDNTGTITGCTNKVNVNGGESVGGIAGVNKGWIEKSENHGSITGMNSKDFGESFSLSVKLEGGIGGIAGGNYTNVVHNEVMGGQITGCINRGEIKRPGDYNNVNGNEIVGVGGIVGQQNAYRKDSLKNCANYGAVTGPGGTGGIAGKSQGPVTDCTNNGSVTQIKGATVLVGGVVGHHLSNSGNVYLLSGNANNGNVRYEYTFPGDSKPTIVPQNENYSSWIGGVVGRIESNGGSEAIPARYQNNYFLKTESINPLLRAIGGAAGGLEEINSESVSPDRLPNPGEHFRGEGTEEAPYKILSKKDLEALRDAVNAGEDYSGKYFQIADDIDLGGSKGQPWTPIGTGEHPFNGVLDGGGHTISGLCIDDETKDNQGLFGVNAGTIKDLKAEGTVKGHDNVGGIAGTNAAGGTIIGCTADVNVTGNNHVGGIAGKNDGTIESCTSYGSVTGNDYVGGTAGSNGAQGTIKDSVNNGNVSQKEGSTGTHIGGIAGENQNNTPSSVTGTYYKTDEVNKDLTGVGGKTDEESGVTSQGTPIPEPGKDFVGEGTPEKPYQIYTAKELQKIQEAIENKPDEYKGAAFELMDDIALPEGESWTPIGSAEKPFEGTFNGNGHTVSGLAVNDNTKDNQGLFGVNAGTIENLTVGGSVAGKDNVGGIAGTNTAEGVIRDCIGNAEVSGENNVGGLVGKNEGSVIRCATKTDGKAESGSGTADKGSVTGTGTNTGGIAGSNDGVIKDSTNNADVAGGTNTGGVTGNNGNSGTVLGGGNNGNVTSSDTEGSKDNTGGLVGKNENEAGDSVSGSYKKDETTNKDLTGIGGKEDAGDVQAVTGDVKNPQKPFEGSGTVKDPYKIKTEDDLKKLADLVNSGEEQKGIHYTIEAEGGITLTEKSRPWTPIGTEDHPFDGTFDGGGNTVKGLEINDNTKDNQGLFGVNAGTIENLTVEGSVTGKDNVGGIAGTNTETGTIKDCTADVTVKGHDNVGGIAGKNDGAVTGCTNKGSVAGSGTGTGGITGTNNGTAEGNTNKGTVAGKDNTGGITGTNGTDATVKDNTNSGNVTGENGQTTGAVIGKNENTDPKDITGNYYQKTDEINKDINGIGGVSPDPAGISSGTDPAPEKYFEEKGTEEDPYRIESREDLEALRDSVNGGNTYKDKYFEITGDIDLGGEGNPWTPIGTKEHPFEGTLLGDGHKVSGLHVNNEDADNQGLFGVNAGTIENLTVEGNVTGKDNVGGIAGINTENGTIKDCTADVAVNGHDNVGGIAGKNDGAVTGSTNKGTVTGTGTNAGGITGTNDGTAEGNTNKGTVTGGTNAGGITGTNDGTAEGNTNSGTVAGKDNTGGITGTNGADGTVKDNTNSGNVTGENGQTTGAVIGTNNNQDTGDITGNYYQKTDEINKDLTGIGEGTGAGTDPEGITSGSGPTPGIPLEGSGTREDPYKITSREDLEALRDIVNKGTTGEGEYFKVTGDIDLGGEGNPWTPIGTGQHPFEGTLLGDGHKVSGLHTDNPDKDNQGLFGVNAGTIENLTVEGSVTGKDNVGGIAGTNTETGTIKGCTADVTVNGHDNVGGIAGKNDGTVTGCTNKGSVTGTGTNAGGITGTNNGSAEGNTNSGNVTGGTNTGGITGTNNGNAEGNTNSGSVTGEDNTGGITGTNNGNAEGNTNKGSVTGGINTGGITGTNGTDGTVKDNTNSGNVTGEDKQTTGAVIGTNNNQDTGDITGNYYQKTDEINKDLTGIGGGTGAGQDPAGITSGQTPTKPTKPVDPSVDQAAADHVKRLIDAIPSPVKLNDETKQKIDAARAAYEALTAAQKALVPQESKKKLEDAEKAYSDLAKLAALPPDKKQQVEDIVETLGVSIEEAQEIQKIAEELGVDPQTLLITDASILKQKSESDIRGSVFNKLQAKATKVAANKATLTWKKVKGADGYLIYGNRCGKNNKLKLLKTLKGGNKRKYTQTKLKKNSPYKYVVRAYKLVGGRKITISVSKMLHVFTTGKYVNAKGVKLNKTKVSIKKGKTFRIKAKTVLSSKKGKYKQHRKICYESSNAAVATVTKKGVIKGKKKGTCKIYAYAQNGVYKTIKVTVK